MKDHLRSFALGAFYAVYIFCFDRAVNLRGVGNVGLLVLLSIVAMLITVGTIKVPKDSAYHITTKWFTLVIGLVAVLAAEYAFLGVVEGHQNFLQALAAAKSLPPAVQGPLEAFIDFGAHHGLLAGKP